MAMIGRSAAIAEVGPHRHELHGALALRGLARRACDAHDRRAQPGRGVPRLGLGFRSRPTRGPQVLDRAGAARIDWDEDPMPGQQPVAAG